MKVLASAPWPEVRPALTTPSQPVWSERPWACSSWPSWTLTTTSLQEMPEPVDPSSGSVTQILYGILSVNDAIWPFSGNSIVTVGVRLPTVTTVLETPVRPPASATVSLTW